MIRHVRRKLLGWCTVSIAVAFAAAHGTAGAKANVRHVKAPVAFHVTLANTEYKRSEPIEATLSLENKGKRAVWVNTRFYVNSDTLPPEEREVLLEVTSPTGEKLPCTYSQQTGFPKSEYFKLLKPGQTATAEQPRGLRNYFDFAALGRYTVVGIYTNVFGQEIGLDALTGPVRSKPVTFTIVE